MTSAAAGSSPPSPSAASGPSRRGRPSRSPRRSTCPSGRRACRCPSGPAASRRSASHADSSDVPSGPVAVVITVCGSPAPTCRSDRDAGRSRPSSSITSVVPIQVRASHDADPAYTSRSERRQRSALTARRRPRRSPPVLRRVRDDREVLEAVRTGVHVRGSSGVVRRGRVAAEVDPETTVAVDRVAADHDPRRGGREHRDPRSRVVRDRVARPRPRCAPIVALGGVSIAVVRMPSAPFGIAVRPSSARPDPVADHESRRSNPGSGSRRPSCPRSRCRRRPSPRSWCSARRAAGSRSRTGRPQERRYRPRSSRSCCDGCWFRTRSAPSIDATTLSRIAVPGAWCDDQGGRAERRRSGGVDADPVVAHDRVPLVPAIRDRRAARRSRSRSAALRPADRVAAASLHVDRREAGEPDATGAARVGADVALGRAVLPVRGDQHVPIREAR